MFYMNKFFKTKEDAVAFQKKHGGALYSNAKYSKTKKDYRVESFMVNSGYLTNRSDNYYKSHPYCVAWNEEKPPKKYFGTKMF